MADRDGAISWADQWAPAGTRGPGRRLSGLRLRAIMGSRLLIWLALFLPTFLAATYFLFIAADQYETESRFVVRSAAKPDMSGGLAFLVQLGLARSQDDSFIVQNYLTSRDAVAQLKAKLPLLEMYGQRDADFIARYPSFLFGRTDEEFYRYLQYAITVFHTDKTGISTLRVKAFRPDDAQKIAVTLLSLGEDLVNRINHRLRTDAVGNSLSQLEAAQQRLIQAQTALTEFRNRELIVDPTQNAVALSELISRLSGELAATRAQVTEMMTGSASSPQLLGLRRKATALEEQIARERARIASSADGLAARIADYERLSLEREFANRMVGSAEEELVRARADAARQLLYLERIVEPNKPDYSTEPRRWRGLLTVFVGNLLLVMIGWLVISGIREHAAPHE